MRRHPFFRHVRRALAAPVPLLGLLVAVGPLALASGSVADQLTPAEATYRALPALPAGSGARGRAGVEASALALADSLHAVPVDALGGVCQTGDLRVSWQAPGDGYTVGAHVSPVGPAPTEATTSVNGIVTCTSSTYAYMGFEARWSDDRWDVVETPFVGDEEDDQLAVQPPPVVPQGPKPVPVLAAPGTVTGPIEGYAAYEPQRTCDPTAKVGTRALAGALLRDYTGSRNLGIVRPCGVGGRSEHKEGRAFDWGVNIANPSERAAAEAFIKALLATDGAGNRHALMRRMGVMYVIWNSQIISSYRINEGWRPYSGASAHRDHVHISLSWAGALGRTSFWSGTVPPDLPVALASASTAPRTAGRRTSASAAPRRWTPTASAEGAPHERHRWGGSHTTTTLDEAARAAEQDRFDAWRQHEQEAEAQRAADDAAQRDDARDAWRRRHDAPPAPMPPPTTTTTTVHETHTTVAPPPPPPPPPPTAPEPEPEPAAPAPAPAHDGGGHGDGSHHGGRGHWRDGSD
jgi:hypothetical protein